MNQNLAPVHGHAAASAEGLCPNCHALAAGKFCSVCGESTIIHPPSAFEFLHEFVGHYVALEGKLWQSLLRLLFKPGQLTAEYLHGRRVRYVNPLRLYLTLSLIVFALIRIYGVELPRITFSEHAFGADYSHKFTATTPGGANTATLSFTFEETDRELAPFKDVIARMGDINPKWESNAQRFIDEAPKRKADILNQGFLANLPYMLIGALPLFALYLKGIYWRSGRRYGEHLVFALHANAFAFLLASVMIIVPGNVVWLAMCLYEDAMHLTSAWDWLQLLPFIWLVAYLPTAMRRVYGGSRPATALRWLVLIAAHVIVISLLVIGAEMIAILKYKP